MLVPLFSPPDFKVTDRAPLYQGFPDEPPLDQAEHKRLDGGEGEGGGHIEEGDQLRQEIRASPEPIFNSHS